MRIAAFFIWGIITAALVYFLNRPLMIAGVKTPRLGYFFSPQQGFWQNAEPANASFNASLKFPDLQGRVEVYFDERLVPHVYAESENDAYFVQGYLHAKFRLWQMEFQTFAASGRLSEIMGDSSGTTNFLEVDRHFRRMGMVWGAERSLKKLEEDPVIKSQNDAYAKGVNAYISMLRPNQVPFEYKLLNYKPEQWSPLKTMLFQKYISYEMTGTDWDFEMTNAKRFFSPRQIEELYPVTQDSLDPIMPRGSVFVAPSIVAKPPLASDSLYFPQPLAPASVKPNPGNGSNNWAVAGAKTQSGAPILCNDPHLDLNLPSIWYEMQITAPTLNVYGVSFPGAPSIIIGFNDSCAWGITSASRDVKDYYQVQFRDNTMQEYLYDSVWLKTTFRNEIIKVKGAASDTQRIAMTVFGPVMYDATYPAAKGSTACYALRWKALDESNELMTFNKLNHAKNYVDYIQAIKTYQCPGQNFVFASKAGDIAIRQQGQFPAKWRRQGDFIMPGTDSTYKWQGFIPSRENPTLLNPVRGFVSSANQLAADESYPYYLAGRPDIYRGITINRNLQQMNGITIADMQRLQNNNFNFFAQTARPLLLKYLDESGLVPGQVKYLDKLKAWNLLADPNEVGPTVFDVWWDSLEVAVFSDEFARANMPLRWPDQSTLLEALLRDSSFSFVDDLRTPHVEQLQDVVLSSFKSACNELSGLEKEHRLTWSKFKNTGVFYLLKLPSFGREGLSIGGGENVINATKHDHGPSWKMIVELTAETKAFGVYPGGQSGNPGSRFYDNFIKTWVQGKYYPLQFVKQAEAEKSAAMKWNLFFSKS